MQGNVTVNMFLITYYQLRLLSRNRGSQSNSVVFKTEGDTFMATLPLTVFYTQGNLQITPLFNYLSVTRCADSDSGLNQQNSTGKATATRLYLAQGKIYLFQHLKCTSNLLLRTRRFQFECMGAGHPRQR